ncbi:MAG: UvrD-helicase domain-containing protein [Candidatus Rokubacteria bacterium]|nr:UvrD-helicase domain-containing protein [Candidatus Rokubacteria bacterium]
MLSARLDPELLLRDLNPPQREAVTHTEGPLLVLAGAGSGKTRVIAHRIAYLLGVGGVHPRNVLAVTFTNKAAEEMLRRVQDLLLPVGIRPPLISTFHSACVRILREHIRHLGLSPNFVIYDEDDRLSLVKECLREEEVDERALPPAAVVSRISHAKNQMLPPQELDRLARGPREERIAAVYHRYQERLTQAGALDFDDLLLLTVRLWEKVPEVLAWYRGLWPYVLIDEYQDTNRVQYRIIQLLTQERRNLCVVGDDDQAIYRFRGATLRNILDFERDFPGTRVIRLEQNYRSTKRILAIASTVIANNAGRKGKTLWTENTDGDPARVYRAWDESQEAAFVAHTIGRLRSEGVEEGEVAIFYRTNAQSRVLEDALRRNAIPYVIVGGVRFYERREIKDALAYLRLTINPVDEVAFKRAIAAPSRGVGRATLSRLEEVARREKLSLLEACGRLGDEVSGKPRRALEEFGRLISDLRERTSALAVPAVIDLVVTRSGYRDALRAERTAEAEGRLENLEELLAAAEEFQHSRESVTLEEFLDTVALLSDVDEWNAERGAVTLMTLHSAKGLEFPVVFLTGMEEGVFPHVKSMEDPEELEEERRLCYVGLTRAKRRLYLSYALHRRLHGGGLGEPSRFLLEIPEDQLTLLNAGGRATPPHLYPLPQGGEGGVRGDDWDTDQDLPYRVGARLRHARWGEGLLVGIERQGEDVIVTVHFASVGRKRLSLQYAHLEEI